jgi:hypothetical protein
MVSTTDATSATTPTTVSSRMRMAAAARPAPLALGASDPSRPQAVNQATTLITVVQTQPRRRCSSRTVAATSGSESVTADSGEFTPTG